MSPAARRARLPLARSGGLSRARPLTARPHTRTAAEVQARRIVGARSHGICEACSTAPAVDWSHRVPRSAGGPWTAANGLALCRRCHAFCHARPAAAKAAGLVLESWQDPATERVWLQPATAWPGWWLLEGDLYVSADTDDPPPAAYPCPVRRHPVAVEEPA